MVIVSLTLTLCSVLLKRGQCVFGATFKIILNVIKESKVSEISHHSPTSYEARHPGTWVKGIYFMFSFPNVIPMSASHQKTKGWRRVSHLWGFFMSWAGSIFTLPLLYPCPDCSHVTTDNCKEDWVM